MSGLAIGGPEWIRGLAARQVYVWGAGQQGRGMVGLLRRAGVEVCGFIDSSPALQGGEALGLPVRAPESLATALQGARRPFVIIAAFFHEPAIAARCASLGLQATADFVSYKNLKPYDYAIDVAGGCNLRCLGCPRASHRDRHPPAGLMTAGVFENVLDKIMREDPLVGCVQLYQWGEPLTNPELPEIIGVARRRQLPSAISSNLASSCDLAPVIAAGPSWFRVSISGVGAEYERVHVGARWSRVEQNMRRLAQLRAALNPEMKTEVFYHLYRDNQGASLDRASELCAELGFELHPVWAYLISLDDVLEHLEGAALSAPAQEAAGLLALSLEEGIERAREQRAEECPVTRCIHINWNLAVSHCMMFFYPQGNIAAPSFLETPLSEIAAARAACGLCRRCRAQALHRYCAVYNTLPVPGAR